jgi:hypothetical protein
MIREGEVIMERIKSLLKKPFALGVIGLLVGLIIGLVVLGWWLWPVTWVNGAPSNLSEAYQTHFLCMTIDSYIRNNDQNLMNMRWGSLGDNGRALLQKLNYKDCHFSSSAEIDNFRTMMNVSALPSANQNLTANQSITSTNNPISWFLLFCVLTLAAGGALAYLLIKRDKFPKLLIKTNKNPAAKTEQTPEEKFYSPTEPTVGEGLKEKPMAQFMTNYKVGEDLYDESFSIDSSNGEFLGECGVGIAETIGVGDPKKVTALELWLFDKNDIQTVTKVLLSEHAFNDESIKQRLLSKGEPVLAKPGQRFIMETASLQLEARVVDLVYGRGPLPENSFFSRVTIEISVWMKVH